MNSDYLTAYQRKKIFTLCEIKGIEFSTRQTIIKNVTDGKKMLLSWTDKENTLTKKEADKVIELLESDTWR